MSLPSAPAGPDPSPLRRQDWIAGLEKGLTILQAFSETQPRLTATQAGQCCGMTRTVARRLLLTLAHLGFVATDGKLYWLTPRVLRLGQAYLQSARLPRTLQPWLQRLGTRTQGVACLAVLDGNEVACIARSGSPSPGGPGLGTQVPAQLTAAGQLLLSYRDAAALDGWLADVTLPARTPFTLTHKPHLRQTLTHLRTQGWALAEQQLDTGWRDMAMPLLNPQGVVVGALSVHLPLGDESAAEATARVLPVLQACTQAVRHLL
jgi:IclR family pca regulon transcriptional regulator